MGKEVSPADLSGFDSVVVATGVLPRNVLYYSICNNFLKNELLNCSITVQVRIPTSPSASGKVKVLSYVDVLKGGTHVIFA